VKKRVPDRRQTPRHDRHAVPDLRPESVDERAEEEEPDGVGPLKSRVHLTELLVRPTELGIENGLEQREDLPIDVIDRRRPEEERADEPAVATHGRVLHLGRHDHGGLGRHHG
jgi:hypothetical protein